MRRSIVGATVVPTIASCVHCIYPPHDRWAARIKEHCVDNADGLDGQRQCHCARQPPVQSKVDVLSALPATAAKVAVQMERRLNLARQIVKMATRIDCRFLTMSDPLVVNVV